MKLVSLNIGKPRDYHWLGKTEATSIYKNKVEGPCNVNYLGIEGDTQCDTKSHGGVFKAVYSYDVEFYEHWKKTISRDDWVYGMFGENLTTQGLPDDEVTVGNIYKIGTAKLQAIQPRFPCQTLCARFGMKEMIQVFIDQKRHGTYFKVAQEGSLNADDEIELLEESDSGITIRDITECKFSKGENQRKLKRILELDIIPESLKQGLRGYLIS